MTKHAEVTHGSRLVMGTEWPVYSFVEKVGDHCWLAVYNLCNGVPSGSEKFRTRREAVEAIGGRMA